jgi:hypothetical protein
MNTAATEARYAVCVRNEECEDLELRKIYQILPDERAAREGYVRIVDESGEDYLYPATYFVPIRLPQRAQHAVLATA